MPLKIIDFVLHRIDKVSGGTGTATFHPTADPTDPLVIRLTEAALAAFHASESKPTTVHADFNCDVANYPFSVWCQEWFNGGKQFLDFTKDCTNRLKICMDGEAFSTGGFVIFVHYTQDDSIRKLLAVMLHPQEGFTIGKNGKILNVNHLGVRQIDKAAIIREPEKGVFADKSLAYAGFRKAMSLYFQKFLGPDFFRNPNKDTRGLIKEVENYLTENAIPAADADEARAKLRKYARQQAKDNKEMDLDVISAIIHPASPKAFEAYAAGKNISAVIRPDNAVFDRWKIVRYKGKDGLVLQFQEDHVGRPSSNRPLKFDEAKRTLTITKLEDDLIAKLKKIV